MQSGLGARREEHNMLKTREIEMNMLAGMIRSNAELPYRTKFGITYIEVTAIGAVADGTYIAFIGKGHYKPLTIRKQLFGKNFTLFDGCGATMEWTSNSVPTKDEIEIYNSIFKARPEYKILDVKEI